MEKLDRLIKLANQELSASPIDVQSLENCFTFIKRFIEKYFATFTNDQILQPQAESSDLVDISNFHSGLLDFYFPLENASTDDLEAILLDENSYFTRGYRLSEMMSKYGIGYCDKGQSAKQLENGVILFIDFIDGNKPATDIPPEVIEQTTASLEAMFQEWQKKIEEMEKEIKDLDEDEDSAGEEWKKK